jgi:iron complex outermembrane receptor protein
MTFVAPSVRAALALLLLSAAPAAYAQAASAPADDAATTDAASPDAAADAGEPIVVTARNRSENLNDVPIPISVLGGETIAQQRAFTLADLTQRAPGLTATTPNARRTGVSLRGIGKTSGNDNMEAAVGVIVDDVFLGHVGMTYQDFTDLQQVEILRGPQGTLLGKNTSLGVIKYTSKAPSFTPEGSLDLETGFTRRAFKARGSYSGPLLGDVLAFRASFFFDRQDGDILNVNPALGGRWHERKRWGGRVQVLYKPSDRFSLRLNADLAETNENSNTKPFVIDPATLDDGSVRTTTYTTRLARGYFGGYKPIIGSLDTIDVDQALPLITRNQGISLVATWDVGPFEIKSISALRDFHFDANNDSEQTRFAIQRGGTLVDTRQLSQELRLSGQLGSQLTYQAGLYFFKIDTETTSRTLWGADAGAFYASNSQYRTLNSPAGFVLLQQSLKDVRSITYQNPVSNSQAAFAQADWKPIDGLTITAGLRYTREQKRSITTKAATFVDGSALVSTGNATADAIRANQIGVNYTNVVGEPIRQDSVAWLINPSYKLSPDVLLYASASGGGKSGAVAFDNNGNLRNVKAEKTTDFELGLKGDLFHHALSLSVNLYYTKVRDYQATTSIPDPISPIGFSSVLGNIPGLRARGVEFEASARPFEGLTLNLAVGYNDAKYTDWSTATCPRNVVITAANPTCNNTGKQLVGAPLWTVITGFDFEREIGNSGISIHAFGIDTYRTSHNLEQLLSPYGFQKAYHLTDAGIGIITNVAGHKTEFSVVGKNVFDTKYTTSVNDFSNNAPVGYDGIGPRRYIGLLLRTKF